MNVTRTMTVESSSNIAAIYYTAGDPETDFGTLKIVFHSGGAYEYANFGASLAEEFFGAESKGKFFHSKIKNQFIGVKVQEVPEEPTETRFSRQRELETEATGKLESQFEKYDDKIQAEDLQRSGSGGTMDPDPEQNKPVPLNDGEEF